MCLCSIKQEATKAYETVEVEIPASLPSEEVQARGQLHPRASGTKHGSGGFGDCMSPPSGGTYYIEPVSGHQQQQGS
jgi:hypothetical protein